MKQIRIGCAIAILTCLTGFSWPVEDSTSGVSGEPAGAAQENAFATGSVVDRVTELQRLALRPEISEQTLAEVREILFSPVEELRAAALGVIGAHGRHSDEQLLIRLLSDRQDDVQVAAVKAIASFGSRTTAVALAGLLDDQSADVRVATLKTLGLFAQPATTFPVLDLLLSHDARVEMAAIRALGEIGDPRAVPALAVRLESQDYSVALAASQSLAQIDTVEAIRAVLVRAAGLRQQAVGITELATTLEVATPGRIVDAILAEGGNEVLDQVLMSITLPATVIRLLYAELKDTVEFEQLSERLKMEAIVWDVVDDRLDPWVFLEQSPYATMVIPQGEETREDSCTVERMNSGYGGYGYRHERYERAAVPFREQVAALRSIFLICGAEHTASAVSGVDADDAAQMVRVLSQGDPLREWLLAVGATWNDSSDDSEAAWTLFSVLSEATPAELAEYSSVRFSDNAMGAALAFGWATHSLEAFFGMLSDDSRLVIPPVWRAYASSLTDNNGREATVSASAAAELLPALQVAISQCSPLSDDMVQAIEREGSAWVKSLRDLHSILCDGVTDQTTRALAMERRRVSVETNSELEFAPGENATLLAASLWQAAVAGTLTADNIDRCVRYSLGEAPQSVRTACLLAAERASGVREENALMLETLRDRSRAQATAESVEERTQHIILISDRTTGRGVWGAPLLLFLTDGTTIETTAGAYGFLAVPSSTVTGVSP